jgi:hypothetical protein
MEEEKNAAAETETAPVVPEEQQPDETKVESEEPVDEKGVPLKNRLAEANRKLRKVQEAQEQLTQIPIQNDQEEAIRIVREIAREEQNKALEPLLAKQFLIENPDAVEIIEDINRIRSENPELAGVDKLNLAYKIAKAEKQDEIIRKRVESEKAQNEQIKEQSTQATAEGVGKTKSVPVNVVDKINSATSLKELEALEDLVRR